MTVPVIYANQIAAACALLGWTNKHLAEKSDVSLMLVNRATHGAGEANVPLPKLAAICGALNAAGIVFTKDLSRLGGALDTRKH